NAFGTLDKAINRAWGSEKVPGFIVSKLLSFAMMLALAGLLVASVVVSTVLTTTRQATQMVLGKVPGEQIFWQFATIVVSFLTVLVAFLLVYRFLPRLGPEKAEQVALRDVWPGAVLAAIAWVAVKELFALYLGSSFANYNAVYGPVGTIIALLTWIYVSSVIILVGAEFAAETYRVRRLRTDLAQA